MKKIVFTLAIVFSASVLFAQKDTSFYRHELKISFGDPIPSLLWTMEKEKQGGFYGNTSVSYLYRPVKWVWVGGDFIYYFGKQIRYEWREYYPDGKFQDLSKSKIKYAIVVAPEVRFSYLNKPSIILYSALSAGMGWESGFDSKNYTYPQKHFYIHITGFGISGNFGEHKNIFLGGEVGIGYKGIFNVHFGCRF